MTPPPIPIPCLCPWPRPCGIRLLFIHFPTFFPLPPSHPLNLLPDLLRPPLTTLVELAAAALERFLDAYPAGVTLATPPSHGRGQVGV